MFKTYLRANLLAAFRSAWRTTNGLGGAAFGGLAAIWFGAFSLFSSTAWWAKSVNWLAPFVLYSLTAWILLFAFHFCFTAPYSLWKREQSKNSEDCRNNEVTNAQRLEEMEHDRKLAGKVREIFPEPQMQKLYSDLYNQHAYWDKQGSMLSDVVHFLDSAEAHFLNEKLRTHADSFVRAGANLLNFMAFRFFVYPHQRNQAPTMFALQPNWNVDREGNGSSEQDEKYTKLTEELESHLGQMSKAYDALIRGFHTELLV